MTAAHELYENILLVVKKSDAGFLMSSLDGPITGLVLMKTEGMKVAQLDTKITADSNKETADK